MRTPGHLLTKLVAGGALSAGLALGGYGVASAAAPTVTTFSNAAATGTSNAASPAVFSLATTPSTPTSPSTTTHNCPNAAG